MARKKINKFESENSYRLSEEYMFSYAFNGSLQRVLPDESSLVGSGKWIMVVKELPTDKSERPKMYSIYWATPCAESKNNDGYDKYGRYKVEIIVRNERTGNYVTAGLFPDEYTVVDDKKLKIYIEEGWSIKHLDYKPDQLLSTNLIEQSRTLTEDDREIIMAYQLDGLTEHQACELFFEGQYVNYSGQSMYYDIDEESRDYLKSIFVR